MDNMVNKIARKEEKNPWKKSPYFPLRSPSCLAISRSYPSHLVKFHERKIHLLLFFFRIFYSKRCNFFIWKCIFPFTFGYSPSYPPSYPPRYPPGYQLGYPPGYLPSYPRLSQPSYLISLSYPMAIFIAKLFGLFYIGPAFSFFSWVI